jgi:DNA-binding Xre family transcriptional regulator
MTVPYPRTSPEPGPDRRPEDVACELSMLAGRNVRRLRGSMSARELGEKAGVSPSVVTAGETGRRNITLANLADLAAALGVDPADLLRDPGAVVCTRCKGEPYPGFRCGLCGRPGGTP